MRYDFFVHADALPEQVRKTPTGRAYLEKIAETAREASFAISVSGGEALEKKVAPSRTIYTIPYQFEETGKISENQAEKLRSILGQFDPTGEFRIYGTYFGCCIQEFAVQLFGLVYKNEFWRDYPHAGLVEDRYVKERTEHKRRVDELIRSGAFRDSNIKYGVVFQDKEKPLPEATQELARQLTDSKTLIY